MEGKGSGGKSGPLCTRAVLEGDSKIVQKLLAHGSIDINMKGKKYGGAGTHYF